MKKLLTYYDCKIDVIQCTQNPNKMVRVASRITQHRVDDYNTEVDKYSTKHLIKYILTANHTSIFEHCYITVYITNVSRSVLAQITRHRMGSFTSASQHYQEYDEYPNIMHANMYKDPEVQDLLESVDKCYKRLIASGVPKEEARQILPNAKAVNILWTVNARSLINFLNLRLCERNVHEMVSFANKMRDVTIEWWPELFSLVDADCIMHKECRQGRMSCGKY